MTPQEIQRRLAARGLHVEPAMAQYVAVQIEQRREQFPVMGCESRTGVAVRREIGSADLLDAPAPKIPAK